ncbi:MAG: hypothetical protein KAT40_09040, partial [Bacteroidales bacterium]|nr:hypothetical protein [Bacteroidales bacterium]
RNPAYPTYLYYNPHDEDKVLEYYNEGESVDLYDAISHRIVATRLTETGSFILPANQSMLIVAIPSGSRHERIGNKTMLDDIIIAYR